jgi:hypothetical protein
MMMMPLHLRGLRQDSQARVGVYEYCSGNRNHNRSRHLVPAFSWRSFSQSMVNIMVIEACGAVMAQQILSEDNS